MMSRWFSNMPRWTSATRLAFVLAVLWASAPGVAGDAPGWLHSLSAVPLPKYPDDPDVVRLFDERIITVKDSGEVKTLHRRAYKILRPQGRHHGTVVVSFDSETRLSNLKGWCIPAQGKDYEVKEKDALETGLSEELYSDERTKILTIPAAEPGSVIGYEYEQKERPYLLQNVWWFQDIHPVREAHLTLQLPSGWEYKAYWLNHPEKQPISLPNNQWRWDLADLPAVPQEPSMPPAAAVQGRLVVLFFPNADRQRAIGSWSDLAKWYGGLMVGRREASPEIKQKVMALTAGATTTLEKIRALVHFLQRDIRYVAIEIGIGGYQPHSAQEVFSKRYGDCKDKATLLSTMLREVGVESYYVVIHTRRGVAAPSHPPALGSFNHVILAIRLPADVSTGGLFAVQNHEHLGTLLYFDPTSSFTPLGYLPASLQANYGLLVTEQGGELLRLPLLPPSTNRLMRMGKLTLSPSGTLTGEVKEVRWGEPAVSRRAQLLEVQGPGRTKMLESFLATFLGGFTLTKAEVGNLEKYDENLMLDYNFVAENYAKRAGNLLLVRPRVLGQKSSDLLERKERKYPFEFSTASMETDTFEIALPPGYEVDELPPPVDVNYGFAAYRSKIEVSGGVLKYSRTYEVKDVFVSTAQLGELKKFYRQVMADEFTSAVLRRSSP
ncbi:MAG: DUF3857 domain-containing protein [Acidobacteria bacterium]|nr:DUF3857 domain-containing protein [Acidobacteriota bacterium]